MGLLDSVKAAASAKLEEYKASAERNKARAERNRHIYEYERDSYEKRFAADQARIEYETRKREYRESMSPRRQNKPMFIAPPVIPQSTIKRSQYNIIEPPIFRGSMTQADFTYPFLDKKPSK